MVIYFGADHGGFELKARLKDFVKGLGYELADMGNDHLDHLDDYPVFAAKVAERVQADASQGNSRGILICRSGAGMDIAANKFKGVYATLGLNPDQVFDARHDDNINVLVLAADFTSPEVAENMVRIFLSTPFGGDAERYQRRIEEIRKIENG